MDLLYEEKYVDCANKKNQGLYFLLQLRSKPDFFVNADNDYLFLSEAEGS